MIKVKILHRIFNEDENMMKTFKQNLTTNDLFGIHNNTTFFNSYNIGNKHEFLVQKLNSPKMA